MPSRWKRCKSGSRMATGGSIRCEIIQKAMSALPSCGPAARRKAVARARTNAPNAPATANGHGSPSWDTDASENRASEKDDDAGQSDAIGEATQPVGRCGTEEQGEDGTGSSDDNRIEIRAKRIVAEIDQDVVPGMQRRLEVNERQIGWSFVDMNWKLEGGDGQPVERKRERPLPRETEWRRTRGRRGVQGESG
jgi:hypothetical protein